MTAPAQPEKTFLFHIGLPKTGTTSIQGALINLLPEIEQLGFCHPYDRTVYGTTYPNPGVPSMPAQTGGLNHFAPSDHVYANTFDWQASVDRFLASPDLHTYIFSQENMALMGSVLSPQVFGDLRQKGRVRFLIYLRHPVTYINSFYLQNVTGNAPPRTRSETPFFKRYCNGGFTQQLRPFARHGSVTVRDFDAARQGGNLVRDAFEAIGCAAVLEGTTAPETHNVTRLVAELPPLLLALKFTSRWRLGDWNRVRNQVTGAALRLRPPLDRLALSRRETDAIMARWQQDRVTLRDSYGLEIRDPDFTPGPEVLQFSSGFAAEIRDQVAAKFSDSDMAALDLALGLADTDIEEIVAAEPKPGIQTDLFRPRQ